MVVKDVDPVIINEWLERERKEREDWRPYLELPLYDYTDYPEEDKPSEQQSERGVIIMQM